MAKAKPGARVALQLDTRIALEAIILNRLQRIPEGRRQEWLRGLLVQGFRQECQALRATRMRGKNCPQWLSYPGRKAQRNISRSTRWAHRLHRLPAAGPTSLLPHWAR